MDEILGCGYTNESYRVTAVLTFLSPIIVAYPGARLTPLSIGKGISPCVEMSILIPASGVKSPTYSSCSTLSSKASPVHKIYDNTLGQDGLWG